MNPTIIDSDTGRELWRVKDCAAWCNITNATWTNYVARGIAPAAAGHLDARSPLWDAEAVKAWHASRPGSPVPGAPGGR
ncbi:helix-turn-helix transcriptional regulator [Corynebacterium ulceribovis]|uniref:helix-turn-helix transcriptional regulator n=1 Tax=Corynebacterium ulceribovis TaxID=487732 RepID=UPI000475A609|nr:hypothetical protein [Corynebacterium ulceribovis]